MGHDRARLPRGATGFDLISEAFLGVDGVAWRDDYLFLVHRLPERTDGGIGKEIKDRPAK